MGEERIVDLVNEHTKQMEAEIAKLEKINDREAARLKFKICESAAKDVKYVLRKLQPPFNIPQAKATALLSRRAYSRTAKFQTRLAQWPEALIKYSVGLYTFALCQ